MESESLVSTCFRTCRGKPHGLKYLLQHLLCEVHANGVEPKDYFLRRWGWGHVLLRGNVTSTISGMVKLWNSLVSKHSYTKEIAVCGTWMTLQNALEKSLSSSHTFIQKARKGGRLRHLCWRIRKWSAQRAGPSWKNSRSFSSWSLLIDGDGWHLEVSLWLRTLKS